ncbi:MAG: M20/M25/M40 family metallo-hydrolase [Chloroflexi bacterium]|nr:M20/M25/M40 family metallo-hydrolase [Chloroflexota bacterium]
MDEAQLAVTALSALESLCRIPSAPYYEGVGAEWVRSFCEKAGLEVRVDRYGNVLATRHGADSSASGLAFVAHLDHPGFEALAEDGGNVVGEMRGGLSEAAAAQGVRVQFVTNDGRRIPGKVIGRLAPGDKKRVMFEVDRSAINGLPCAVVLDLVDFSLDGDLIRARALDDLAGCAATAAALEWSTSHVSAGPVYGLFTRAEEVGLEGSRLAAEDRLLPEDTTVVSVESSRTLPGAEIGSGPVIRAGDRISTFDRDAEAVLRAAADRISARDRGFKVQRQLMSGGVCEASAFAAFGYRVTGLAFPLGNYHNAAPAGSIAAEYINAGDFANGVRLLAEAATLAGTAVPPAAVRRFGHRPAEGEKRLLGR